jgi:alpha-D-ribose 1-methylphosphonate 5-triphosphate synthase subunit PhnG
MELTRTMTTKNTETDFARSVDVGIETTTTIVGGHASHSRWLGRIGGTDFHFELEEAKLVRCIGRTDDETAQGTDIVLEMRSGKC